MVDGVITVKQRAYVPLATQGTQTEQPQLVARGQQTATATMREVAVQLDM